MKKFLNIKLFCILCLIFHPLAHLLSGPNYNENIPPLEKIFTEFTSILKDENWRVLQNDTSIRGWKKEIHKREIRVTWDYEKKENLQVNISSSAYNTITPVDTGSILGIPGSGGTFALINISSPGLIPLMVG